MSTTESKQGNIEKGKKKALFLDRDGTLNEDNNYPHKIEDFRMLPGVVQGLQKLKKEYLFIIVTNQSGVGRGIFTEDDYHTFHNHLLLELGKHDIEIKKTYYSTSHPDHPDQYRKPSPKALLDAANEFNLNLQQCWMIGDHGTDVLTGQRAGCKTIYMMTGHGKKHLEQVKAAGIKPDHFAEDFFKATKIIQDEHQDT